MKSILRSTILISFLFLFINSCSKDSPVPDAVVPTPTLTFTLAVTASEGGSVNDPGDTHNENANVSLTATPADGYVFSGWSGDASGSTNPLIITMTGDKNITASFIRLQYSLSVNIIGSGTVSQVLVESSEKNTDYDPFSTVRLTALPVSNWIFYGWSGSTTETTNEVDIVMEETKSVTATFEEKLSQIIGIDDVFFGNGKWKIRKPKGSSGSGNTVDESSKQMLANCALSEIIFRTDGSFTIISGTTTTTGQFTVDSNTTISLTQSQSPFGTITNLVITNNFINFSLSLASGCDDTIEGDRDDTYDESTDPNAAKIFLASNGVTIKCPNAEVGYTEEVNGKVYEVVDNASLRAKAENDEDLTCVCTSNVTDMHSLFLSDLTFNQDIGNWDTSNVTDMNGVFEGATSFNQDISSWNISSVVQTGHMFDGATSFNQDIGSWNISNAVSIRYMFANSNFNQDIGSWDTSKVNDMQGMFYNAKVFNQNIGNWNTSNVTVLMHMFLFAESFNQPIGNWDISSVTNMNGMFGGATNFNQDLTNWCVSNFQSQPDDEFSSGSALTEANKPIWGTCPSD